MGPVKALSDSCEECLMDRSLKWPDYCYEPVSIEVSDGNALCRYECRRHRRTWTTSWMLDALDAEERALLVRPKNMREVMAEVINSLTRDRGKIMPNAQAGNIHCHVCRWPIEPDQFGRVRFEGVTEGGMKGRFVFGPVPVHEPCRFELETPYDDKIGAQYCSTWDQLTVDEWRHEYGRSS